MIIVPYVLLLIFLCTYLIDIRKAILVAVLIRPITDCFYENQFAFAGLKPTEYLGVLLPTLIVLQILVSDKQSFTKALLAPLWIFFLYFQLLGVVLIMTVGGDAMLGVNYFFRAFNGFIGFYLFQEFFTTRREFKILLIVHIIAGLFPLGMSFYQNVLGGVIKSEATIGGLVRNIGFYHDAYTLRLYCFQTLAAIILYWTYFLDGIRMISRTIMVTLSAVALLTIYKLYSKAGYLVCAEWLLVWNIARKKYLRLGVIAVVLIALGLTMQGAMTETVSTVYSKEVGAVQGKEKSDRLFQGRVGNWKTALREYADKSIVLQLVGDGSPHTGAHNDFIRALLGTGIIGLLLYVTLLGSVAVRCTYRCFRESSPLNIMAVMLIGMWLIDAIGLVPGAYPGYQIFVWGFVGLALRGVKGLKQVTDGGDEEFDDDEQCTHDDEYTDSGAEHDGYAPIQCSAG